MAQVKQLFIIRKKTSDQGTFGTAMTESGLNWHSGELPWVDDDKNGVRDANVSCIAQGRYQAKRIMSPKRLRFVYQLLGVKGGFAVQIHKGNFCGKASKGFVSQVEGCILLGNGQGKLQTKEGPMQEAITHSEPAIEEFMGWAGEDDIQVVISEQFPGGIDVSPESKGENNA